MISREKYSRCKRSIFNIIQIGDKHNLISRSFDIFIVIVIFSNIISMFLETFDSCAPLYPALDAVEKITTLIFCIEYALRIWTADYLYPGYGEAKARLRFLVSYDGIVDLLTIVPAFFLSGFVVFRMLRVVRIFHLFRINAQYDSFNVIRNVLWEKRNQIVSSVFIILILMLGSSLCMYSAEHDAQPEVFKNAFSGLWWSVSTILTVGYGDIYPVTTLGKCMAILIAILGVGVVAIPTGIISAGFVEQYSKVKSLNTLHHERSFHFITVRIGSDHVWNNTMVKDAGIPQGMILALIIRGSETIVPRGDTVLQHGDQLVLGGESYIDSLDIRMKEISIEEDHEWAGQQIMDLDISRLSTIIMITRGHRTIVPAGSTVILAGDEVLIYTKTAPARQSR